MNKKRSMTIILMLGLLILVAHSGTVDAKPVIKWDEKTADQNIVDIISSDSKFTVVASMLKAAGLEETLQGNGPFTVFVPTDTAFMKLPKGSIEKLLKSENKGVLVAILTYHVYPGELLVQEISELAGNEIEMISKQNAKIRMKQGNLYIDGAKIVATDIMAKNGVIHVIHSVMLPNK